jgi:MFS family permease
MIRERFSKYSSSFWRIWASAVISGLGDGVTFVALPLLAASLTREPVLVAAVTVAAKLPWLLVSPVTGVLTDRLDRRRVLWQIAVFQAGVMGLFAAAVGAGAAAIPLLLIVAFVMASAETLAMNASAAVVPDLVDRRHLPAANSLVQGGQFVASDFVGLALGAALFSVAYALPFTVDAVTFALSALLLVGIAPLAAPLAAPPSERVTVASLRADIAEGVRWLLRHRLLRALCLLIASANFAVVGVMSVAVLYALEILHVSATTYGLLMVIVAVGGMVGLVLAPMLCERLGLGRTVQLTFLASPLPFLVAGLTSTALVAAVSLFFVGASVSLGNVASMTIRQAVVPRQLFGRVNASFRLVSTGLGPLGGALAGVLAQLLGLRTPFIVGAVVFALAVPVTVLLITNRAVADAEAALTPDAVASPGDRADPAEVESGR